MKIEQNNDNYVNINNSIYGKDNQLVMNYYAKRVINIIEENGKNFDEIDVLDLGIGHRITMSYFKKFFKNYTILEGDIDLIQKYKKDYPNESVKLIHTFFEDYDNDKKYDVVILGFVCEHVENPRELIKKYKNFLKNDGIMFIVVPNSEALNRRIGKMAGIISDTKELSEHDIAVGHKRYYDKEKLSEDCEYAGLLDVKFEGIFLKPITTQQFIKLNFDKEIMESFVAIGKDYPELSVAILAVYYN